MRTIYCERPVHEVFEEYRYYFSVLYKDYELVQLPKVNEVPTNDAWVIARCDEKHIGIQTWEPYPY